jgi:predicted RNA-binding Zn-ribbon protein involved in translation (DUF1610 family)
MSDFRDQLEPLRFWNRAAMLAFVGALPLAGALGFLTSGTVFAAVLSLAVLGVCLVIGVFGYIRIRVFRCPRCGNSFTIRHRLDTNSRGRKCVHCGLDAYV